MDDKNDIQTEIVIFLDDDIKKITNLGSIGYSMIKCLNVLQFDEIKKAEFIKQFDLTNSLVNNAYQVGIDLFDFEIDTKLLQLAKTGDLNALKKLETRKGEEAIKEAKRNALNNGR